MLWERAHPRKVRGGAIHETMNVKREFADVPPEIAANVLDKKYVTADGRVVRGWQTYAPEPIPGVGRRSRGESWHEDKDTKDIAQAKTQFFGEQPELVREHIEATYLVPQVENFVETPQVKKLEDRVKLWIQLGHPVHIIGPTGCGKTTLAMKIAKDLGRPTVWINGDETVTTTDLVGGYSQIEQQTLRDRFVHNVFKGKDVLKADWVDNPLTLACKYGYTLVYNEFSRTQPAANNVLLSVLEECILELPTKFGEERYVDVNPEFHSIFTSNSVEYAGVHRPQDALLDRMIGVYMDFYDFGTEVEIVKAHTGILDEVAKKVVTVVRKLREKLPEAERPGTRACILIGQGLAASGSEGTKLIGELCTDVLATKVRGPVDLVKKQQLIKEVLTGLAA